MLTRNEEPHLPALSTTLIRAPTALHAKLKAFSATRGQTMVDVLHNTVRRAEEAGEIACDIPNFRITLSLESGSPRLTLGEGDTPLVDLSLEQLPELCNRLDAVTGGYSRQYMALDG